MPRKNFKNIGELQGYEYLKGVITDDPDLDADTCTVKIKDSDGNDTEFEDTPIFYHCSEDAEEREDNGAIEGAAFGFVKDDEVIVLKQRQGAPGHDGEPASEPKIFVIGHLSGIAPCCFIEPWDGPLVVTKRPWITEYIYFHSIDADGIPDFPTINRFNVSTEDGALIIHKEPDVEPEGGWDSIVPDSWGEDDYHQCGVTYPVNPATLGNWDIPVFKPSAQQVRVSLGEIDFTCCRWPTVAPRSIFEVNVYGFKHGTTERYVFAIYFISESALGDYKNLSAYEIYNQGRFCLSADLMTHNYQMEFAAGGNAGVSMRPDVTQYYAYIPMVDPVWLKFPFLIDVCSVQVFVQLSQRGMYTDWTHRQEIPGITARIDNIEIC